MFICSCSNNYMLNSYNLIFYKFLNFTCFHVINSLKSFKHPQQKVFLSHKRTQRQLYIFAQSSTRPTIIIIIVIIEMPHVNKEHGLLQCMTYALIGTCILYFATTRKVRSNYELHHGTSSKKISCLIQIISNQSNLL